MLAARSCSLAALIGSVIFLACSAAWADDAPAAAGHKSKAKAAADADSDDDDQEPKAPLFSYGVGLLGFLGADFIDKPSDRSVTSPSGASGELDVYPGFGGVTAGGGLMLEGRLLGIFGLELDLFYSSDRGHGEQTVTYNRASTKYTIDVGQTAFHVPLLFKATIPAAPSFRPSIFVGPEFVFPGGATTTVTPQDNFYSASAGTYTMVTGGIGFEFKLPISGVDLRIPVQFRGSYHSVAERLGDRADFEFQGNTVTHMTVRTEWKYQVQGVLGLCIWF